MRCIFISTLMLLFFVCFVYSQNVNDQIVRGSKRDVSGRGISNPLLDIRKRDALPLPMPQAPAPGAPKDPKQPAKGGAPPKEPAKAPAKAPPKTPAKEPAKAAPAPPPPPEPPKQPQPNQPKQPQPNQPKQPPATQPKQDPSPSQSTVVVVATGTTTEPSDIPTVRPFNTNKHASADKLKFYQGNSWIIILVVTNFLFFTLL
jgi:outer membrane biosynthesis protein TonB